METVLDRMPERPILFRILPPTEVRLESCSANSKEFPPSCPSGGDVRLIVRPSLGYACDVFGRNRCWGGSEDMQKASRIARGFLRGRTGLSPASVKLFRRRRLLIGRRRWGAGSQLIQVVLQEADFNASAGGPLRLRITRVGGLRRGIAHTDEIDAVDRDVVVQNEITD